VTVYEIPVRTLDGNTTTLSGYRGQVLLVVTVASKCGFTPQYEGLEALYRRHHDLGFSVLGFPCDQFAHQEPGNAKEIRDFCTGTYGITFPLFAKIDVNGPDTHPLFRLLKRAKPGLFGTGIVKWNFTKFLISREGRVLARYSPRQVPAALEGRIKDALRERL